MHKIDLNADELSSALLALADSYHVCILDSCGVSHLGSHLLIVGIEPVETFEFAYDDPFETLATFEELLSRGKAAIFTIAYALGPRFERVKLKSSSDEAVAEPDIFVSLFETLFVHDYNKNETHVCGKNTDGIVDKLFAETPKPLDTAVITDRIGPRSNFTREQYMDAVETIKEYIRCGDTYQANLTQQIRIPLQKGITPEQVFARLRRDHPAPFAAFLKRTDSTVVSASPERFFKIEGRRVSTSPIKGTRPRGSNAQHDACLRDELIHSEKDRAENTMIVDLLRNDLGRVCEYGSVDVERLCVLEEHPTLFHLVSTINGRLREDVGFSDVLRSLFPCGSITGAPKVRTMEIIDEIETVPRGLSMGAIGYFVPKSGYEGLKPGFDLSVAIRTMVIRDGEAVFNVGGGITIDSDAAAEYDESMLKAKALLAALGNKKLNTGV